MNDKVPERETKRADELAKGDWIAAGPYTDKIDGTDDAEVLHTHSYGDAAVAVTIQEVSVPEPLLIHLRADAEITLLTDAEITAHRELLGREAKIAEIRAMADALEAHPWLPVPAMSNLVHLHGDEGMATVLALAERYGLPVDRHLDDRTEVYVPVGSLTLDVIAWHRDGRPAEAKRGTTCEELDDDEGVPTSELPEYRTDEVPGLDYSRADDGEDDPTPVSPARVPDHAGAVTEDGIVDQAEPVCAHNDGDALCGVPIKWVPGHAKWFHFDEVWRGHEAEPVADAA